ncbi:leucine rich repeat domain protein [Aspergillus steynii IBT 23096]|uniref:Leucine rich repeat domain protein n=1 Tax=Aspergillus steynii IBT 23096 TaxID=1392250 RepID=A0A2I2GQD7_9EURO|nr:leucine rich repeat domain protein [Aspergillus steynii IBT 23096]PLB55096.1 leucine rich repeat domain protein [Aspergillus steynii IBT 23096]
MSSAAASPALCLHKPRYPFAPQGDSSPVSLSRSSSPRSSECSSPDGSRSTSRRRPSVGSIKEDVDGIAQSFVDTHPEEEQQTSKEPQKPAVADMQPTPDFCCPCGGFLGWKQIRLGGKSLSRSYSDLRQLGQMHARGWAWEATPPASNPPPTKTLEVEQVVVEEEKPVPGTSLLEKLPPEVLDQIISKLALDVPPNGYTPRNVDLIACLLASRTLHAATLAVLYRNMTFPHSIIFSKALNHMSQYPALGTLVRRLDFSHFTSVGLGRTKQMNAEIQNLTATTLLKCLDLLPNLKECLLQEHVEGDISVEVMQKLFTGLPNLFALDLCGCSTQSFSAVFQQSLFSLPLTMPNLRRISMHECSSLPASAFETLLPRLVNLTHLDVTHTQINEAALFSIPETARITHLSLSRTIRLRGAKAVEFLTTHPAVTDSLVFLNLMTDPTRYRLLEEEDVSALLPKLPSTLRSLNIGGAKVTSAHTQALIPLTKHLEELGLGSAELSAQDLNAFFTPAPRPDGDIAVESVETWVPPSLCYLDLTKASQLTLGTVFNTSSCLLLSQQSYPLQVIEFHEKLIAPLRERTKTAKSTGWTVRELGRRGWYVRDPASMTNETPDDGARTWKMGARWWGMRKIPVAVGDVGGIYGHYMFKK